MNTYLAEIIATERIAELRREADARRLAAQVRRRGPLADVALSLVRRWSIGRESTQVRRRTA